MMNMIPENSRYNLDLREALIPAVFPENHASNLLELDNGDLLCAWFSGSGEGNPDTNIVMSRLKKGEGKWEKPVLLSNDPEHSEQNPVLFKAPDGKLWLLHTSNTPHNQLTSRICARCSSDNGYTWDDMRILINMEGAFIHQPLIVLPGGYWLMLAYLCVPDSDNGLHGAHYSVVYISGDNGLTWDEYPVPGSKGLVQMNVVQLDDGSLFAVFRSRYADYIYSSRSSDLGRTWTEPAPVILPNNNSSIQMIKLHNGHLAIVFNDINSGKPKSGAIWGVPRAPLAIAISDDCGTTWKYKKNLQVEDEEYKTARFKEYSYPSIIQAKDGNIHVTYTYLRKYIKHLVFTEEWVQ